MTRFPVSDHCDGQRFHNVHTRETRGLRDVLRWRREARPAPWPSAVVDPPAPPPPAVVPDGEIAVTNIGHVTFLVQMGPLRVLTDPVFTTHSGPFGPFGPRRVRPPAVPIPRLPGVDVVLVSHNHYDHLQPRSLRALQRRFNPLFVAGLGLRRHLQRRGLRRVLELDWQADGPAHSDVNPAEAVQAVKDVGARYAVAMHFGTFQLTDEGFEEPIAALRAELSRPRNVGIDFRVPGHGETLRY